MTIHQSMSYALVQKKSKDAAQAFGAKIRDGEWTLAQAHEALVNADNHGFTLFQIAGLAQAIACYQCSAEEGHNG